jgi:hypothetical protein
MGFKDYILQLSERVIKLKDSLSTEEATKTSLVLPFIQALGYDFFNPYEVVPELQVNNKLLNKPRNPIGFKQ